MSSESISAAGSKNTSSPPAVLRGLLFLIPPCAGLAVATAVIGVFADDYAMLSVWRGASVDKMPDAWLMRGIGLALAVVVWLGASILVRGKGGLVTSLSRVAPGFGGFLSILVLNTIDAHTGVGVMYWSVLATIYSVGFLGAWVVVLALWSGEGRAWRAYSAIGRNATALVVAAAVFYFAVSWGMSLLQYRALRISYHDCASFDEMLWRTLHGQFLRATVFGDKSFMGQHLEFIHLFLLPLYVVWPGLPVLMLTQSLGLASGAVPVYLLAKRKLGSSFAAFFFAAAYLVYAPMQYTQMRLIYEIYLPENLAIPILLWALYFFDGRNMRGLLVSSFLAAACKEDMVLPVAMMGLVLALRGRWRWGLPLFVGAVVWFLAALIWVIPYFEGAPSHVLTYFADMGGSVAAIAKRVIYSPLETLGFVLAFHRVDFLLMMLVPMGMLALLSPTAIFIFLPSIASNVLASWAPSSSIYYHYHISLVPFAVAGAIFGAANLVRILPRVSILWGRIGAERRAELTAAFCAVLVFLSSAGGDVVYGKMPISLQFYNPNSPAYWRHIYVRSPRAEYFVRAVLPTIPRDAKVCASQYLATRFTRHAAAYVYPQGKGGVENADYIVLERDEPDNPAKSYIVSAVFEDEDMKKLDAFDLFSDENGICVFKRRTQAAPAGEGAVAR